MRHTLLFLLALATGVGALGAEEPKAPLPRHGGIMLDTPAGRFEVVYESSEGTLTVHAVTETGEARPLAQAPVLILEGPDGPRSLPLAQRGTGDSTWKVTDRDLRGERLSCKLRLPQDGGELTVELCAFLRPHEGLLLLGGDALRLVVSCPAGAGHLVLRPFTSSDAALLGAVTPEVVIVQDGRETELPVMRASSTEPVWLLNEIGALRGGARAIVRARVADRTLQSMLQLPTSPEQGLRGGTVVPIGSGALRMEVVREPAQGRVSFFVLAPPQALGAALEAPPQLVLGSESSKVLTAVAVRDAPNAWIVESPELRSTALHGIVRVKLGAMAYEIPLPATLAASQPTAQAPASAHPQPKGAPPAPR